MLIGWYLAPWSDHILGVPCALRKEYGFPWESWSTTCRSRISCSCCSNSLTWGWCPYNGPELCENRVRENCVRDQHVVIFRIPCKSLTMVFKTTVYSGSHYSSPCAWQQTQCSFVTPPDAFTVQRGSPVRRLNTPSHIACRRCRLSVMTKIAGCQHWPSCYHTVPVPVNGQKRPAGARYYRKVVQRLEHQPAFFEDSEGGTLKDNEDPMLWWVNHSGISFPGRCKSNT